MRLFAVIEAWTNDIHFSATTLNLSSGFELGWLARATGERGLGDASNLVSFVFFFSFLFLSGKEGLCIAPCIFACSFILERLGTQIVYLTTRRCS